jgi:hypothetical protein
MLVAYIVVVVVDRTYDDQYPCKLPVQARFGEHAKGHFFWASRAASRCQTGEAQKNCPAEAGLISTDKPTATAWLSEPKRYFNLPSRLLYFTVDCPSARQNG